MSQSPARRSGSSQEDADSPTGCGNTVGSGGNNSDEALASGAGAALGDEEAEAYCDGDDEVALGTSGDGQLLIRGVVQVGVLYYYSAIFY